MAQPTPTITEGRAKWAAAGLLSVLSVTGLAWSIWMRTPTGPRPDPLPASRGGALLDGSESAPEATNGDAVASAEPEHERAKKQPNVLNGRLNLNTASESELELLPGVGPALAGRILDYRSKQGPFKSIDDLDAVKGIGPKTLEKLRPLLFIE